MAASAWHAVGPAVVFAIAIADALDGVVPVAASLGFATADDPSHLDGTLATADSGVYVDKGERRRLR